MTKLFLLRLKSGQLITNQTWKFCYSYDYNNNDVDDHDHDNDDDDEDEDNDDEDDDNNNDNDNDNKSNKLQQQKQTKQIDITAALSPPYSHPNSLPPTPGPPTHPIKNNCSSSCQVWIFFFTINYREEEKNTKININNIHYSNTYHCLYFLLYVLRTVFF